MLNKTKVINTISKFPEQFSIDDLVDKMILLEKIENGIKHADNGKAISDDEPDKKIDILAVHHSARDFKSREIT